MNHFPQAVVHCVKTTVAMGFYTQEANFPIKNKCHGSVRIVLGKTKALPGCFCTCWPYGGGRALRSVLEAVWPVDCAAECQEPPTGTAERNSPDSRPKKNILSLKSTSPSQLAASLYWGCCSHRERERVCVYVCVC